MKSRYLSLTAVVVVGASVLTAYTLSVAQTPRSLPDAAKSTLDKLYPGWRLADISDENREICFKKDSPFLPTLVWGDFTGHNKRDYAAIIRYSGKTGVVVLVAQGATYFPFEVFVAAKRGERPPELLDVMPRGAKVFDRERNRQSINAHESVVMEYCESSSVVYVWTGKSFTPVVIGD